MYNSGVLTFVDEEAGPLQLDVNGNLKTTGSGSESGSSATSTTTGTASSATTVVLKALNTSRKSLSVFNNSTANLYIKEGRRRVLPVPGLR